MIFFTCIWIQKEVDLAGYITVIQLFQGHDIFQCLEELIK